MMLGVTLNHFCSMPVFFLNGSRKVRLIPLNPFSGLPHLGWWLANGAFYQPAQGGERGLSTPYKTAAIRGAQEY